MPVKKKDNSQQLVVMDSICHHCGACVAVCPEDALFLWDARLEILLGRCSLCCRCLRACPVGALAMKNESGGG